MKIKELTISKHRKIGLPNYSSIDFGVSITVDMDEKDQVHEISLRLQDLIQAEIDHHLSLYEVNAEIKEARDSRTANDPTAAWGDRKDVPSKYKKYN
jgi:hypothetical protein